MTTYRLTDDAISHVAKTLQIALLTGTDIIDNLRAIRLVSNTSGELALDPEYSENFDGNINDMLEKKESLEKTSISQITLPGVGEIKLGLVTDETEE